MTVDLYMHWRTPYNPAVAGLTVEAWEDSLFSHSPVGNPGAYPPASSPTATTTTDSSGNCELTGLTADTNYYVSIIDENNRPWFVFCPSTALGNLSTTRRQFSIVQGPVAVSPSGPASAYGRATTNGNTPGYSPGAWTVVQVMTGLTDTWASGITFDNTNFWWLVDAAGVYDFTLHGYFTIGTAVPTTAIIALVLYLNGSQYGDSSEKEVEVSGLSGNDFTLEVNDQVTCAIGDKLTMRVYMNDTGLTLVNGAYFKITQIAGST